MRLPSLFAAAALALWPAHASSDPVVLELFTSQGCSSCPPADHLLQQLAAEPGIIALSRPVDYWDRLGWVDTLATPENTARQYAYAAALGGRGRVYTPQLVVNGSAEGVGSNPAAVRALIRAARASPRSATLATEALGDGRWRIRVTGGEGAGVHLIGFTPHARVEILAGENEGEEVSYTNAVRSDEILGTASGSAAEFETPVLAQDPNLRWAIVLQHGQAGPIRAAALLAAP